MSIYVTGDTHGEQSRIDLIERETRIEAGDYLLVCGDFGFIFTSDVKESDYLNFLRKRSIQSYLWTAIMKTFPLYSPIRRKCGMEAVSIESGKTFFT